MPNKQLLQINIWIALYYIEIPEYNFQLSPLWADALKRAPRLIQVGTRESRIETKKPSQTENETRNEKPKPKPKSMSRAKSFSWLPREHFMPGHALVLLIYSLCLGAKANYKCLLRSTFFRSSFLGENYFDALDGRMKRRKIKIIWAFPQLCFEWRDCNVSVKIR